jgi:adenylate kinase
VHRADDREEVVGPRLQAYERQTAPVVEYYRGLGLLKDIDGAKTVEQVTEQILEVLRQAH